MTRNVLEGLSVLARLAPEPHNSTAATNSAPRHWREKLAPLWRGWFVGKLWQQRQTLGRKMDLPYPRLWYGKLRAGLMPTSMCRREEKEVKRGPCCLPELGCLATYIDHVPRALIHLTAEIWERKCQTPIFENLFFCKCIF